MTVTVDTFFFAFNAVMPIMLLVLVGYVLRCLRFGGDAFFQTLNRLCFRLFLPVQLFSNVLSIRGLSDVNWRLLACSLIGFSLVLLTGYLCAKLFVPQREQQGVVLQAAYRSNQSIIGLPLSEALGGAAALTMASLLSALFVPIFNVLAVVILTVYSGRQGQVDKRKLLHDVAHNPLILSISAGLVIVLVRQLVPQTMVLWAALSRRTTIVENVVSSLGRIASPLMLVTLGARFNFRSSGALMGKIALGTVLRLVMAPAVGLGTALALRGALHLTGTDLAALMSLFASPVAVSSPVMVQEIGGDEQLASQLVVWSSVFCLPSMFLLAFTMRATGLL